MNTIASKFTESVNNFYTQLADRLNMTGDKEKDRYEPRPMLQLHGAMDKRPLIKDLGNWVEKEGYLFFDSMVIPHPAGFIASKGLYEYTLQLRARLTEINHIESLLDVAIRELAAITNNPEVVEARSFKFPNLSKLDNGSTVQSSTRFYTEFFGVDKSKDRDVFTVLFKNANELNKTAVEVERLVKDADAKLAERFNDKVARLSALAIEINQLLVEDTDRQRKDVVAQMRDNVISPLAEWCEVVSIYLYQVNVLKVCFSDIEEHIQNRKK